jgi:hypothetical protein
MYSLTHLSVLPWQLAALLWFCVFLRSLSTCPAETLGNAPLLSCLLHQPRKNRTCPTHKRSYNPITIITKKKIIKVKEGHRTQDHTCVILSLESLPWRENKCWKLNAFNLHIVTKLLNTLLYKFMYTLSIINIHTQYNTIQYMSSSKVASAVYNLISELYNIIILGLQHYVLHHYLLPNIPVKLSLSHMLNFKICGAGMQTTHI